MLKFIAGLVLTALCAGGLVGIGAGEARAIECPYSGCVRTVTNIKAPDAVVKRSLVPIRVTVRARSGTANPRGTIHASCSRPGKAKSKDRRYRGEPRFVFFKLNRAATWTCTVRFTSARKFRRSADSETVQVTRR